MILVLVALAIMLPLGSAVLDRRTASTAADAAALAAAELWKDSLGDLHEDLLLVTNDDAFWALLDRPVGDYRSAGMAEAAQRYAQRNDSVLTDYAVDVWNARVSVRVRSAETVPGTDQYVYSEATAELRLERGVCLRGGRVGVVIGGTCRTEPLPAPPPEPEPEPTETDDDDDEPEPEPTPEPPYELPSNLERTVVVETRLVAG